MESIYLFIKYWYEVYLITVNTINILDVVGSYKKIHCKSKTFHSYRIFSTPNTSKLCLSEQHIHLNDRDQLRDTVGQADSHYHDSTSWSRLHEPLGEDKELLPSKAISVNKPCCAHPVLDWPCSGGSAGQFTNSLEHEVGEDGVITLHLPFEGIISSRKWTAMTVLPYRKMSSDTWRACLELSSRKYPFHRLA